jgi:putative transposase
MINGFQFRCKPTPAQEQILLQWIGCQPHIYNAKVSEDQYFRRFARKSLQLAGQHAPIDQQYAHFKTPELTPWLSTVPSQILRNGANLWASAYAKFFNKLGGRPVKHHKHGAQSVWITSELFEFVPSTDSDTGEITYRLLLGTKKFPVGELKLKAHRSFKPPAVTGSMHGSLIREETPATSLVL